MNINWRINNHPSQFFMFLFLNQTCSKSQNHLIALSSTAITRPISQPPVATTLPILILSTTFPYQNPPVQGYYQSSIINIRLRKTYQRGVRSLFT